MAQRPPLLLDVDGRALLLPVDPRHGLRARDVAEPERWVLSLTYG
ncbi:hypothetical protein [Streptomyces sp. NPDC086519]